MSDQRRHTAPILIKGPEDRDPPPLEALSEQGSPISESRLQELLALHPGIIPVREIEPVYGPLTCLGREVPTPAGPMDILYVSPDGYLTLVETKLWTSAESRREVVAQIIDYAKELAGWCFEELDAAVRRAVQPEQIRGKGMLEILHADGNSVEEGQFQASVTRSLQRGELLLLIVGNRIRSNVESITSYLQRTPGLHFRFGLLELALYRLYADQDWPLLVQPRLVARTAEIVRAVVDVRATPEVKVIVGVPEVDPDSLTQFYQSLATTSGQTVKEGVRLLVEDLKQLGLVLEPKETSVSLCLPDPSRKVMGIPLIYLTTNGKFLLWLLSRPQKAGYGEEIGLRYLQGVAQLTGARVQGNDATNHVKVGVLLNRKADFLALVQQFMDDIGDMAKGALSG